MSIVSTGQYTIEGMKIEYASFLHLCFVSNESASSLAGIFVSPRREAQGHFLRFSQPSMLCIWLLHQCYFKRFRWRLELVRAFSHIFDICSDYGIIEAV